MARLITLVEDTPERAQELFALLAEGRPTDQRAHVVGYTGPPGAGKSTLLDRVIRLYRDAGQRVGVLAVDPSSPFTGGAVLGDRIRMERSFDDPDVFIRSLSCRGALGGLAAAASSVVALLETFGFDVVLVETVGVGQSELDVVKVCDTVVVVLVPEAGDAIQAMKAGLTEIADIVVVNKADRPGAAAMAGQLAAVLHGARGSSLWQPLVLQTCALENLGLPELALAIRNHRSYLEGAPGRERRRHRRRSEFDAALQRTVSERLAAAAVRDERVRACLLRLEEGDQDPYSAVSEILGYGVLDTSAPALTSEPANESNARD